MEDVQGQKKPVLYLNGEAKGWMINRTNAVTIGKLYGGRTQLFGFGWS